MLEAEYLSPKFEVIHQKFDEFIPLNITQIVNETWRTKPAEMFDGEIFFVTHLSPEKIEGFFLPYRYFYARRHNAQVASHFSEMPTLAVTGCVRCNDGELLFAQRSSSVEQDKGEWELLPSGGVNEEALVSEDDNEIDLSFTLKAEIQEELGVGSQEVMTCKPFAYVWDKESGVVDIGMKVLLNMMSGLIISQFIENEEYVDISTFPPNIEKLSPVSRKILDLYFSS